MSANGTVRTLSARALKCPECGAPAEIHPAEPVYHCHFCNTSFTVDHTDPAAPADPFVPGPVNPFRTPEAAVRHAPVPPVDVGGVGRAALIIPGVILLSIGGVIAAAFSSSGSSSSTSSHSGTLFGSWNGKQPLVCSGNDYIVVDHVTARFASGVAIDASGNCSVNCTECKLEAPLIVRARENAEVSLQYGSAEGPTFFESYDNASVTANHTRGTGAQKKNNPPMGGGSKAVWPTSGPFVCGDGPGGEFRGVHLKVTSGPAIVASINCHIKLTACTIEAPIGMILNDNADVELDDCQVHTNVGVFSRANGSVIIEGGSFIAKDRAADLADNSSVHAHGAKVQGSVTKEGNATFVRE